jgi:hypothetical protein
MSDLLHRASRWLAQVHQESLSQPIRYIRGDSFVDILATIGETTFEQLDREGILLKFESRDFIFPGEVLRLGGSVIEPVKGDRIEHWLEWDATLNACVGTLLWSYEVMALGTEPVFRYSDRHHGEIRVHTKEIASASTVG